MGNKSTHAEAHSPMPKAAPINPNIAHAFHELSGGAPTASREQFTAKFGERLGAALHRQLTDSGGGGDGAVSQEQLVSHADALLGGASGELYLRMLLPPAEMLRECFACGGVALTAADEPFIQALCRDMTGDGEDVEALLAWRNAVCPRLCQAVQQRVCSALLGGGADRRQGAHADTDAPPPSDVLTPAQMFILQRCLPTTVYLPQSSSHPPAAEGEEKDEGGWLRLYSSVSQGISVNRLETNAFDYRGATLNVFKLTSGETFALALDEAWRHSVRKFGGPSAVLLQLAPAFRRLEAEPPAVYCNFKNRSDAHGIRFGRHLSIDGELANVAAIEVWGCAGVEALQEQQKHKLRMRRQAERHAVVPRNWDDNPDKAVMEMAGFQFSSERRDDKPPEPFASDC